MNNSNQAFKVKKKPGRSAGKTWQFRRKNVSLVEYKPPTNKKIFSALIHQQKTQQIKLPLVVKLTKCQETKKMELPSNNGFKITDVFGFAIAFGLIIFLAVNLFHSEKNRVEAEKGELEAKHQQELAEREMKGMEKGINLRK